MGFRPENSWHWGFGVGAVGMFLGLIQYRLGWKYFGDAGIRPAIAPESEEGAAARRQLGIGIVSLLGIMGLVAILVRNGTLTIEGVTNGFSVLYVLIVVGFFAWLFMAGTWTPEERKRLIVIVVLFAGAAVFWSAFEQAASTLNLFALQNTRTSVFGWTFPSSWFQSVNAVMIVLLAPVFAWIWVSLGKRDPTSLDEVRLRPFSSSASASSSWWAGRVPPPPARWSARCGSSRPTCTHTIGELCLSPVGLSSMTKLARPGE
jgi:POT family proton-dependent oligopeptide transporter